VRFFLPQTGAFIELLSLHSRSSFQPNLPQKASPLASIIHNGAPSKGRTNTNTGGMIPSHIINHECPTHDTSSSSRRIATSTHLPLYEDQILHMLNDMKEQMKEQQAQSDRHREQAALDCENVDHEHEVLK